MIVLNPPTGLRDVTQFPDEPGSSAAAREQIQSVIDQVVNQVNEDIIDKKKCRSYHSVSQSIAAGTEVDLNFNTTDYDTDAIRVSGDNRIFNIKTAGTYVMLARVVFAYNTTGRRKANIVRTRNSVRSIVSNMNIGSNPDDPTEISVAFAGDLLVGDSITVSALQTSGGSLGITTVEFTLVRM